MKSEWRMKEAPDVTPTERSDWRGLSVSRPPDPVFYLRPTTCSSFSVALRLYTRFRTGLKSAFETGLKAGSKSGFKPGSKTGLYAGFKT